METEPLPTKAIVSLESFPKVTTSTLFIPNVTLNDVGIYFCVVWADYKATRSKAAQLLLSGMVNYTHALKPGQLYLPG